jgi:ribosomal protein S18 acetylase RimI-like enzyme
LGLILEEQLMEIQAIDAETRPSVTAFIDEHWFGTDMLIRGEVIDMTAVDGYTLAENNVLTGVITYIVRGGVCEITSLDSTAENRGVGTQLLNAVISRARELGCKLLRLLTTNDNLRAIGFYQKRGFELAGVNLGAIDREREQKPEIPLIGQNRIPVHHEIEFSMALSHGQNGYA